MDPVTPDKERDPRNGSSPFLVVTLMASAAALGSYLVLIAEFYHYETAPCQPIAMPFGDCPSQDNVVQGGMLLLSPFAIASLLAAAVALLSIYRRPVRRRPQSWPLLVSAVLVLPYGTLASWLLPYRSDVLRLFICSLVVIMLNVAAWGISRFDRVGSSRVGPSK